MDNPSFTPASRTQASLLAPLEKKALLWLAHRMPAWVSSDHLTLLGFTAMLAAGGFYALARWDPRALLLVIGCLILNWFGDSLDGTLARVRNCQRPRYGFYVDHVVDAFGTSALLGGLAISGYMHYLVALGVLIAYLLVSIEVYLATYTLGHFQLSFGKMSPTELRILLSIGNLVLLVKPIVTILGTRYRLYDVGGVIAMIGLTFTVIFCAIRNTKRLYDAERLS